MSEPLRDREDTGVKAGLPSAPTPSAEEPLVYQPISGWAIAGFGAGALFAFLVLIATLVALTQGAPMFFPVWIVGLAIVGVILSVIGLRHVQNSEGTRAGAKLARAGIWLSLVSGLSYLSYYFVTGLALQSQANAFVMEKTDDDSGFFPRLREGATDPVQLNAAFLLTMPANQRSVRPDNEDGMIKLYDNVAQPEAPGNLSQFKYGMSPGFNGALPRIFFGPAAKEVKVSEQGAQEWKYEQRSYKVTRNYRIETKELEWDVTLTVGSTEAESAGQGRKWFVNLNQSGASSKRLTRYGEGMSMLRVLARANLESQFAIFNSGKPVAAIKELDKTPWDKKAGDDAIEKRALIHGFLADSTKNRFERFMVFSRPEDVGKWEEAGDRIRIYHSFRFSLPKEIGKAPIYLVDGYVVLETTKAVNPAEFDLRSQQPGWDIVRIVFTGISPMPKVDPNRPGS